MNHLSKFAYGAALLGMAGLLAGCSTSKTTSETVARADSYETGAVASSRAPAPSQRLGTQWGEGISSNVSNVNLQRISNTPVATTAIQYAAANYSGAPVQEAMLANGRIGMSILDSNNRKWQLSENGGRFYLKGRDGERYQLHYQNYSQNTYEIVATVDGLDVLTGATGSVNNSGYVLRPHSTLVIEGFRKSQSEVAAFRFSSPRDAYAANTEAGSPRNIGVIGTAVFELDAPRPNTRPTNRPEQTNPQAFPGDNGPYAPPPSYRR